MGGMNTQPIQESISAGIEFLHQRQLPSGQFRLQTSVDPDHPVDTTSDQLVFLTACVAYCLLWAKGSTAFEIRSRAVDALASEVNERGLSRYYAREKTISLPALGITVPLRIVPDLDTSACAAFILDRERGIIVNQEAFAQNRTPEGLFQTWLLNYPPELDDSLPFVYMVPGCNDVCCGINANVLLALGESEVTKPVIAYLQRIFSGQCPVEDSAYYTDDIVLAYMYSRAYQESVPSLVVARELILGRLLSQRQAHGSYGTVLRTAMAVCVFENFDVRDRDNEAEIHFILSSQQEDGSWPASPFYTWERSKTPIHMFLWFAGARQEVSRMPGEIAPAGRYFGGATVTTAYCIEALSRFMEGQ
jgi:hypothetical protein